MKSSAGQPPAAVSPCLLVESIEDELRFLQAVFGVTVHEGKLHEQTIWQFEVRLGDTILKIGRARQDGTQTGSVLYVWTEDVDRIYAQAMKAGATLISEPSDQPWGVREAGFRGPQGDIWWVGKRIAKLSNREVEARLRQQRQARL